MSKQARLSYFRAVSVALLVTFLWSSSWVLIRMGLDEESLQPIAFAALRYGLAASVLIVWGLSRRRLRHSFRALDRREFVEIVVLGLVFYAVTQGAQFVAIDNQPAATTSMVLSWTPLLVGLLGSWSIGEAVSGRQVAGSLLVVAGAAAFFAGDLGATVHGMLASLVGLGAGVGSALLGRHVNRRGETPPLVVTGLSMLVGALFLAVAAIATEETPVVSHRGWLLIAWLAVVNTSLAFTLWNLSLRSLSALQSAAINNTMLIQIAVLAWWFLDEPIGFGEATGIVLVTLGIVMTQGGRLPPRRRPEHPPDGGGAVSSSA